MGIYSGIFNEQTVRKYKDRELFIRYIKRVAPFKKNVLLISLFVLISTIAEVINPLLVGVAVDELSKINRNIVVATVAGFGYLLLSLIIWIMFFFQRREIGKFAPFFLDKLRMDIFDKLQEQDMSFFDKYESGRLNSRVSNDALDFGNTTILITDTIGNFLISILTFGILVWLNLTLALITLASVPIILLLMFSLRKLARVISRAYRKSIGNINAAMVESIEGIQVCKNFGQEAIVSEQFNETNKEYFKTGFKITATTHMWRPLLETVSGITLIIIVYFGGHFVLRGITNPGTIFMFILYLQRFFRPIMVVALFFPQLSAGMAAYERILEILDSEPNVKQNSQTFIVDKLEGEVVFSDVDFCYRRGEWVFKGLNLRIEKGEKLAIVGHTGAGKSSVVKLISRYYEYQGGSIKVDGIDIRDVNLDSYRRNLGMVQQDVFLFSGTIEENIRYGRQNASEEDLLQAIRAVHAEELIEYLQDGLQTKIGERGRGLSAGQKQLISFARALLMDPKILILDEATSSVDAYTEAIIQEALEVLLTDRTSIIIAHRLSTILNADRIIVMEKGKIIEEGTHESLLATGGKYGQLYKQYFEHQSLNWQPIRIVQATKSSER
ncbi:MAG: ABC transporter ATP-binding protein [Candidatus Lokiarchaeota archaeon]|nr:ABC transporter ATP-binding protein [Candidatus Lokiarchaeota archaeon]